MTARQTDRSVQELLHRGLQLGSEAADLLSAMRPNLPALEYDAIRESWKAAQVEFDTTNARLLSCLTKRQSVLLAAAFAEMLRPMLERWAVNEVRFLYDRTMNVLWQTDRGSEEWRSLLIEIEATPEFHCDDSSIRDFKIGVALDIVRNAVAMMAESLSAEDSMRLKAAELQRSVQAFADEMTDAVSGLGFSPAPLELCGHALRIGDDLDDKAAVLRMKDAAMRAASLTAAALEPIARSAGWPVDRVSNVRCVVVLEHGASTGHDERPARAPAEVCGVGLPTTVLFRPVGPKELELIEATGNRRFPPRLPDQPIFYPVCNEEYATQIARDWNVPSSGAGFVTRFRVRSDFLSRYEIHIVGGRTHAEYWIPAEELEAFNDAIVGQVEVIARFP